jgi:hypothetical protein
MTKTATSKKSWRKHPCWRRKPLPDCSEASAMNHPEPQEGSDDG